MAAILSTIASILLLLTGSIAFADTSSDGVWRDSSEPRSRSAVRPVIRPLRYRMLSLDWNVLEPLLAQTPARRIAGGGDHQRRVHLDLPIPDGGFAGFLVEEDPIIAPGLAVKFPQLRTYRGVSVDDPHTTVRFDHTPHGFHAMILSPGESTFIDPYARGDTVHHISYYKHEYPSPTAQDFVCHVDGSSALRVPARHTRQRLESGNQLRTYRLALAATGEYTAFHGGTVDDAMAAIVTAMNRVNQIYEREVAIRMQIVANNDLAIYTDNSTDPYTNGSSTPMLTENRRTLDAVIGVSNYDIGHVFSTGGGGVANLGVPCQASMPFAHKASGVTGLSRPTGDPFYVDFVAHEMGHQFGAQHTWNAGLPVSPDFAPPFAGSCTPNQYSASTAMEPGSGSTIMAYAGICSDQDLQSSSDEYFHGKSLDEIIGYSTQGPGNTCPQISSTGNAAPDVDAGSDYTIPVGTPFTLCGSGSDADADALTYAWEQFDTGPQGPPSMPRGNAPIFRSFPPASEPCRTFPDVTDQLNGTQTIGEILPTYARTLNFRLTARDNRAGGGGLSDDRMQVRVVDTAGPFEVLAPNGSEGLTGGEQTTVIWDPAGTTAPPVSCAAVDILLFADGDMTDSVALSRNTLNDGSQTVLIPSLGTATARVKVACSGNVFFDIADADFSVSNSPACGQDTVLSNQTITGVELFEDESSITAGTDLVVGVTGTLRLWSGGTVNLEPGFRVRAGGRFQAGLMSGLCL